MTWLTDGGPFCSNPNCRIVETHYHTFAIDPTTRDGYTATIFVRREDPYNFTVLPNGGIIQHIHNYEGAKMDIPCPSTCPILAEHTHSMISTGTSDSTVRYTEQIVIHRGNNLEEPPSASIFGDYIRRADDNLRAECPMGCGKTLFVGEGGFLTCSYLDCPRPEAAQELLTNVDPAHYVTINDMSDDFVILHPMYERITGLDRCPLHQIMSAAIRRSGPPLKPGRYRVTNPYGNNQECDHSWVLQTEPGR